MIKGSRAEYFTPREFVDLALEIAVEQGYFTNEDETEWHPEDLIMQLETIMQTIAKTSAHILHKRVAERLYKGETE